MRPLWKRKPAFSRLHLAVCLGKVTAGNQPGVVEKTLDFASKTVVCAGNIAVLFEEAAGGVEVLTGFVRVDGHRIQRCTQIRIQRKLGLFVDEISGVKQRSEEYTSELQSRPHLVCRLLLEKKKKKNELSV